MGKLNCNEARQISIVDYLAQCKINPAYIKGTNYWYRSPIREENTPSFKVNTKLNSWYDHGIGEGGNFIDLGIRLHRCTVEELLVKLNAGDRSLSFHQPFKATIQSEPGNKIAIHEARELRNLTLISYLHEREIDYYHAKKYCKEVLFSVNGQRHLAIGFENRSGGFELRNSVVKLSSSPKDLTFIDWGFDTIHVTEGFTDFLSLLTMNRRDKPRIKKGGRPKIPYKKSEALTVMCDLLEKKIIQVNARNAGRSVSVFLRDLGLHGRVETIVKTLPKAVLQLTGTLNHLAANINQIAKKRNKGDELNGMDRALLNQEVRSLQSIVREIKNYLSWSEK